MSDAKNITEVTVLTESTDPLLGIIQVSTTEAEERFSITEDLAHKMCTDLERFLTR
jgi:hypothetical protein